MGEEGAGEGVRPPTQHVSFHCDHGHPDFLIVSFVKRADGRWRESDSYYRDGEVVRFLSSELRAMQDLDGDHRLTIATFRFDQDHRRRVHLRCKKCGHAITVADVDAFFRGLDDTITRVGSTELEV